MLHVLPFPQFIICTYFSFTVCPLSFSVSGGAYRYNKIQQNRIEFADSKNILKKGTTSFRAEMF